MMSGLDAHPGGKSGLRPTGHVEESRMEERSEDGNLCHICGIEPA